MEKYINNYFNKLKNAIDKLDKKEIEVFINLLLQARDNEKNIFIMGNGGSASSASHFVCDFNKGMNNNQDKRFKLICLNDNIASMLAYANDMKYELIFVEQLKNFLKKDDLVIGLSGSGNSKNVINAIEYANSIGATTIGLVGYDGGILKQICKYSIHANINNMQISEDIHMMVCHLMYDILMNQNNNKENLSV